MSINIKVTDAHFNYDGDESIVVRFDYEKPLPVKPSEKIQIVSKITKVCPWLNAGWEGEFVIIDNNRIEADYFPSAFTPIDNDGEIFPQATHTLSVSEVFEGELQLRTGAYTGYTDQSLRFLKVTSCSTEIIYVIIQEDFETFQNYHTKFLTNIDDEKYVSSKVSQ